ncbi:hypothetical protein PIB30_088319, partial [Stylosanthes scabra]|nr:hypothetical protein [Stylosanthes scabra]
HEIESMIYSYIEKPNYLILAITLAKQDIATSDAIKVALQTFGVLTKLLLMDKGPNALNADINRNTDMIAARQRESEFFATNPDYSHLASKMGSQHLASLLSKVSIYPFIHLESLL